MKWHYTTGRCFARIIECGEIRPTTHGVENGERPAVWFSTNSIWEPTAIKGFLELPSLMYRRTTLEEMAEGDGGLFRIGVMDHVAPFDWEMFKRESGIPEQRAARLHANAINCGSNPEDWFATFVPVPAYLWVAVEHWINGKWISRRQAK